ncbi:glycosyltransferase [uncultured Helicobacter sp.]|uniref:glycosyltransferase n=1 Tax=uncultured Helicobacter sp. TaxID=175537 RepID=UPI00374E700F
MQPRVSIITVVYNDTTHIIETMESVIYQTYPHIEYILIDGASSDGTTQSIESKIASLASITHRRESKDSLYLEAQLDSNPHFCFKFLSERDSGIYDAMNKGIDLATGEWCNFMNCGDRFFSSQSVSELFSAYEAYLASGGGH